MKAHMLKFALFSVLAATLALAPTRGFAQESKKDAATEKSEAPKEGKKKRDRLPAGGKIAAVDKAAKTIKVGERVFHITAETRIRKDGKTATLEEAKVGEEVGISYRQVDGKLMALSLRLGPAPAGAAKGEKKKREKTEN